ncbi:hypothetical protein NC651_035739 [Populus alba x Populus x berolinensis]|nr:hypothetical protein NC651_035739 [Populus alba x Populus x berolinensis]
MILTFYHALHHKHQRDPRHLEQKKNHIKELLWKSSGSWAEKEQWTRNSYILMCSSSILCIRKILISEVLCAAIEKNVMMASEDVAMIKGFVFFM